MQIAAEQLDHELLMFGSLPTQTLDGRPWQTLLFRPAAEPVATPHPGSLPPHDHYLLDFFHMPIVEPYAISEPFSTAGKVNLDGFEHLTPGERRARGAAAKQRFVHVVVQDLTEPLEVETREATAERFGQRIANGIGMSEAFVLDELERQRVDCWGRER